MKQESKHEDSGVENCDLSLENQLLAATNDSLCDVQSRIRTIALSQKQGICIQFGTEPADTVCLDATWAPLIGGILDTHTPGKTSPEWPKTCWRKYISQLSVTSASMSLRSRWQKLPLSQMPLWQLTEYAANKWMDGCPITPFMYLRK